MASASGQVKLKNDAMERLFKAVHSKQQARDAFRKIDVNDDGKLDADEFQRALLSLGLKLTDQQAQAVLAELDQDSDGAIDREEFVQRLFDRKIHRLRQKMKAAPYSLGGQSWFKLFNHYDRDNSGELSYEEFRCVYACARVALQSATASGSSGRSRLASLLGSENQLVGDLELSLCCVVLYSRPCPPPNNEII